MTSAFHTLDTDLIPEILQYVDRKGLLAFGATCHLHHAKRQVAVLEICGSWDRDEENTRPPPPLATTTHLRLHYMMELGDATDRYRALPPCNSVFNRLTTILEGLVHLTALDLRIDCSLKHCKVLCRVVSAIPPELPALHSLTVRTYGTNSPVLHAPDLRRLMTTTPSLKVLWLWRIRLQGTDESSLDEGHNLERLILWHCTTMSSPDAASEHGRVLTQTRTNCGVYDESVNLYLLGSAMKTYIHHYVSHRAWPRREAHLLSTVLNLAPHLPNLEHLWCGPATMRPQGVSWDRWRTAFPNMTSSWHQDLVRDPSQAASAVMEQFRW
jgi:hypothetical protein